MRNQSIFTKAASIEPLWTDTEFKNFSYKSKTTQTDSFEMKLKKRVNVAERERTKEGKKTQNIWNESCDTDLNSLVDRPKQITNFTLAAKYILYISRDSESFIGSWA